MKIAIIVSTFPPYRAGIGNVAWRNALALAKLGHQVEVFTPDYGQQEQFSEFQVHYLHPIFKHGQAALVLGLARKLQAGRFDAVNVHLPAGFNLAEGVAWAKLTGRIKKYVVYYHMDIVGAGFKKWLYNIYTKFLLPWIIKGADKVTITSLDYGYHSNLARLMKLDRNKFAELPNGADTKFFVKQGRNEELLKKYDLAGKKIIGFVGGLDTNHYFKGVKVLIKAFEILTKAGNENARLMIIGQGDLQKDYEDLAKELGIKDKVIFTGFIKDEDLPWHYNLMDVLVLPSVDKSEAFGLVLVEAMACGVPVIASDLAGVRSVVDREINGLLVKPGNEQDLADKLNYLLANGQVAKEFGLNGRKKAEDKYDWEIIGRQLAGLLEEAKKL
ncbi:MAG: glycosyltransferase family 4 protein [bacterium]